MTGATITADGLRTGPGPAIMPRVDPETSQTFVLLKRWHEGERDALDQLVARDLAWVRQHVEARLGKLLRAKGDVDDYVQSAMVQVLQYGPKFLMTDRAQFRALVAKITENVLRDQAERLKTAKRDVERERPVPTDSILALDPPAQSVTRPSQAAERNQNRDWIRLAIELLPADDRRLVQMREWQDRSFAECAEQLGIAEDAARMRFRRILPKLAQHVERLRRGEISSLVD